MPDLIISGGLSPTTPSGVDDNLDAKIDGDFVYQDHPNTFPHKVILNFPNAQRGSLVEILQYDRYGGGSTLQPLWAHYNGKSLQISGILTSGGPHVPDPGMRVLGHTVTYIVGLSTDEVDRVLRRNCPTNNGVARYSPNTNTKWPLVYNSSARADEPASLGWGWNLSGFYLSVSFDSETQMLLFKDGSGSFERWNLQNGNYVPVHSDNYIQVSKDTSNRYVLTYPNRDVLVFRLSDGKIDTITDRNGQISTYSYDSQHRLISITDGEGRLSIIDYGTRTDGQPVALYEQSQIPANKTELVYNSSGRLWKVVNTLGETELFEYDTNVIPRLWRVTDSRNQLAVELTYNADNTLATETHYGQFRQSYTYSSLSHNRFQITTVHTDLTVTPNVSQQVVTVYSERRLPVSVADQIGNTWTYEYADESNAYLVTKVVDPNLSVTKYEYTANGNLKKVTDAQNRVTTYNYMTQSWTNANGTTFSEELLQSITRPQVQVAGVPTNYTPTQFGYTTNGNLNSITDALNNLTSFNVRSSDGRILSVTDRNGQVTSLTYTTTADTTTNVGNLKTVTTPAGPGTAPARTVTFAYDKKDQMLSATDSNNQSVLYEWDDLGRNTKQTDPLGRYIQPVYSNGRLDHLDLPRNQGSGTNRRQTRFTYDIVGRVLQTLNKKNATTEEMRLRREYDGFGRLKTLAKLQSGVEKLYSYTYDLLDRLQNSTNPLNQVSSVAYDPHCGRTEFADPLGFRRLQTKNNLCQLVYDAIPEEERIMTYDELGRLVSVSQQEAARYADSNLSAARYDQAHFAVEPPLTTSFLYDALDRLVKITYPNNLTQEYSYDNEGRVLTAKDPNGNTTVYTYFNDGRLKTATMQVTGQPNSVFSYDYDAVGQLKEITYPSGSGIVAKFYDTNNVSGWDAAGQLKTMRYTQNGNALLSFAYQYDDSGNRTQMVQVAQGVTTTWDYGYDWFNRLVSVTKNGVLQVTYTFDESDNRITEVRGSDTYLSSYDAADRIVDRKKNGTVVDTFTHDASGRMLTQNATTYTWTSDNRLRQINGGSVQTYDAGGIRKSGNGKEYYSSGSMSVADRGSTNTSFLQGHQILGSFEGSSVLYYLTDGLSSVRMIVNGTGALQTTLEYDEYGQPTPSTTVPLSYVGGLGVRNEGNLLYMRQRWMAPSVGRFLSPDPLGLATANNVYSYPTNPTNAVDPSGLEGILILKARHNHAWIEYVRVDNHGEPVGPKHSWGLFPDGVTQDYEIENGYASEASILTYVSNENERRLMKFIENGRSRWGMCNNCSGWAADAWMISGGKPFTCTGTIQSGERNPTSLIEQIKQRTVVPVSTGKNWLGVVPGPTDLMPNQAQFHTHQALVNAVLKYSGNIYWSAHGTAQALGLVARGADQMNTAKKR